MKAKQLFVRPAKSRRRHALAGQRRFFRARLSPTPSPPMHMRSKCCAPARRRDTRPPAARERLFDNRIEIPPPRVENRRRIAQLLRLAQLCSDLFRFVLYFNSPRQNGQKVGVGSRRSQSAQLHAKVTEPPPTGRCFGLPSGMVPHHTTAWPRP